MRTNNQSRLASSKGIFEAGLIILPDAVFNFTTRSTSFEPPYVSETLPIGQCDRGISFIITITTSPTPKLCDFEFHFRQNVKMGKYPRTHLLQNISVAAWTELHFLLKLISCSPKLPGLWIGDASPISEWFGVNGSKSVISSLIEVKGRPFKTDSFLQRNAWRLSSVNMQYFTIAFNLVLTDSTKDFHTPSNLWNCRRVENSF